MTRYLYYRKNLRANFSHDAEFAGRSQIF